MNDGRHRRLPRAPRSRCCDEYLRDAAIAPLYQRIRDLA